ncbi:MAG: hypothetical protein ACHQAZ_02800, partial [Gammaproteobacteria bacterium]
LHQRQVVAEPFQERLVQVGVGVDDTRKDQHAIGGDGASALIGLSIPNHFLDERPRRPADKRVLPQFPAVVYIHEHRNKNSAVSIGSCGW